MIPVTDNDIESSTPSTISVSATASTLSATRLGKSPRSFFSIIPLTVGVTVTVTFGDAPAIANAGLVLGQNQPYLEVKSDEFMPYQGTINIVASGNGSVALLERYDL